MSVFAEYVEQGTPRALAALTIARGLMAGDPATLKVGYTAENALLAVRDLAEMDGLPLSVDDTDAVRRMLGRLA
jgi:hypothetical protein